MPGRLAHRCLGGGRLSLRGNRRTVARRLMLTNENLPGSWLERPGEVGSKKTRPSSKSPARWVTVFCADDWDPVKECLVEPVAPREKNFPYLLTRPPEGGPGPLGTQERSDASPKNGARSALGLGDNPITVTPEYRKEFEKEWAAGTRERRERHVNTARESTAKPTKDWHTSRANTLGKGPMRLECISQRFVSCGCKAFPVGGCNGRLCKVCNGRRWGRIRRRVLRAVKAQGGSKWRMMTLTGPPRDTPAETIKDLQQAWARLRAWLYKRWKKSFDFVLVVEVGRENGLIHMHVLAKFPGFIDYAAVGDQWTRCYEGAVTGGVDFAKRRDPKTDRYTSIFTPKTGAFYIAKYATKGSELLDLPAKLAAQTMAALVGARIMRASQGFWTPPDPVCDCCGYRFGMAQGSALVRAIALYKNHGKRQLAPDAHRADAPDARTARGPDKFAQPYWVRRAENPSLLVENPRPLLEGLAPSPRQTSIDWA